MVKLKSYSFLGRKKKKRRFAPVRDFVVGGTGALIGIAFVDQTADVIAAL